MLIVRFDKNPSEGNLNKTDETKGKAQAVSE
jgi:hypothetical protein